MFSDAELSARSILLLSLFFRHENVYLDKILLAISPNRRLRNNGAARNLLHRFVIYLGPLFYRKFPGVNSVIAAAYPNVMVL